MFLDGVPISIPVINEPIHDGKAVISGNFTPEEAKELARNLNYGALPVPIELISTQTVSGTLGAEAVEAGIAAGLWGVALVALFMFLWYRLPGIVAVLALLLYVLVVLALFQLIPVTLTAAGIAAFILSRHGGRRQRAHIRAHERRTARRQIHRGRDTRWFCAGMPFHPRLEHFIHDNGRHPFLVRLLAHQRLRARLRARRPRFHAHRYHRLPHLPPRARHRRESRHYSIPFWFRSFCSKLPVRRSLGAGGEARSPKLMRYVHHPQQERILPPNRHRASRRAWFHLRVRPASRTRFHGRDAGRDPLRLRPARAGRRRATPHP